MDKKRKLEIVTIALAFVFSITAVTIAFAAYNSSLTIKGSATAKASKWKVIFKDLSSATIGNDNGVTPTAREVTHPSIVGEVSIETYNVEIKTPGDYLTYNFKIKNDGDFPAQISTFSMPTPTCRNGASGSPSDASNVCSNLSYTLKYVNNDPNTVDSAIAVSAGDDVATGDKYTPGLEREVQLRIYYSKNITPSQLPVDDVAIGNLNVTIPFVQY